MYQEFHCTDRSRHRKSKWRKKSRKVAKCGDPHWRGQTRIKIGLVVVINNIIINFLKASDPTMSVTDNAMTGKYSKCLFFSSTKDLNISNKIKSPKCYIILFCCLCSTMYTLERRIMRWLHQSFIYQSNIRVEPTISNGPLTCIRQHYID